MGLVSVFLPIIEQDEPTEWHSGGVTRTRIRLIAITFSEILIKGKEISVRVSGEFELSEFVLSRLYCIYTF